MDGQLGYQSPAAPDKYLDTDQVVVGGQTVQRERVIIAGPQSNDDGHTFVPTPGTAVQVAAHSCRFMIITADQLNTDVVVIGGPNVVAGASDDTGRIRKGIPLFPNQQVTIPCDNTDQIWVDAVAATDGINWSYFI